MTIQEAHIDFKVKLNKIDTNQVKNFGDDEIDWLLNEAQGQYFRTRYNEVNLTHKGFEQNQLRIDELSNLHIKYPEQEEITLVPINNEYAELRLASLMKPYYHLTSISVYDETCKQWLNCVHSKHSEYLEELKNPFNKFTAIYNFGKTSTDDGTSIYIYKPVTKARLSYLTYPKKLYVGTYPHPTLTTLQGFELPEFTHSLIVDLAVNEAMRILAGDFSQKVLTNN